MIDREWQDGDDTALWDDGYEAGKQKAVEFIDMVLEKDDEMLSLLPTRWLLSLMKKSILGQLEEADDE
jgi:hypothetical protein